MEILSQFTEISNDTANVLKGGIRFKGLYRNTRQPIHLMLLVDTSGSMNETEKLASVKRSIQVILEFMSIEDRISLVTFDDRAKVILAAVVPSSEEREAIQYRISNLMADGSTNLSAGMLEIRSLIESDPGRKQGLIVLTDGQVNMGLRTNEALEQLVERIVHEKPGISISTVGYGTEHNTDLLTSMARIGTGSYNVVMNLEDVASVFGDILGGLITVSVQNLEIHLPPGAEAFTSYHTVKHPDGMITIYVGDIYAEAEVTVMFKMSRDMGPLRIKGVAMSSLDIMDNIIHPTTISDLSEIDTSFILADLRQRVSTVLKEFRLGTVDVTKVNELIQEIQQMDSIRGHPLTPMLLEDLQHIITLKSKESMTVEEDANVSQHAAFFGFARGMRSVTTPIRIVGSNTMDQYRSPYASRAQTQYSQLMRSATRQEGE